jgi:hypothetical protein
MPARPEPNAGSNNTSNAHDEPNEPNTDNVDKDQRKSTINNIAENIGSQKEQIKESVVFNYSSLHLTESMDQVLNRGFNFSILPQKIDTTQIEVDLKKFKRSVLWQEFHFGSDEQKFVPEKPFFKQQKSNMPRNHNTPDDLRMFLHAIESELLDPRNRNKEDINLPIEEQEALRELIKLQKDRKIVIKPCDKGAGIIILVFKDYLKVCYEHLASKKINGQPYYEEVDQFGTDRAKAKIEAALKEGFENKYISEEEFAAMCPNDKNPGKFYCNFKVHKAHVHGEAPPPRPITSGSGSITEGIATFVEFHIQDISTQHETYLQDTPDFLRSIAHINKGPRLNKNAILASFDVIGLFTNIVHKEGLHTLQEQLDERINPKVPSHYIIKLMDIILNNNIFSFNESLWKQLVGAAMGSKPIPPYSNIFLARTIDKFFKNLGQKTIKMLKRFLDVYFAIFLGSTKELHQLLDQINQTNPTIKLTLNHTTVEGEAAEDKCDCEPQSSIPFLDVLCSIKDGKIDTDLYKKPTDRNQYLLLL